MNEVMKWVIALIPELTALFHAKEPEEQVIAGQKLLLAAARHRADIAVATKPRSEP